MLPILTIPDHSKENQPAAPSIKTTNSTAYVIDEDLTVWRCDQNGTMDQVSLPESIDPVDINIGPGGILHLLTHGTSGSVIFKATDKQATDWQKIEMPIVVKHIACGPDGRIWVINEAGGVMVFNPEDGTLEPRSEPGFADEISVGADGRVWVISTEERYAGRVVKWLLESNGEWSSLPAPSAATKVAAAPDGFAWTINSQGAIWRLHPLGSGNFAECQVDTDCVRCNFGTIRDFAKDIAVDANGTVWALGLQYTRGGYQLMHLADQSGKRFEPIVSFGGIRVAAG
jgi:streptogramin lyase